MKDFKTTSNILVAVEKENGAFEAVEYFEASQASMCETLTCLKRDYEDRNDFTELRFFTADDVLIDEEYEEVEMVEEYDWDLDDGSVYCESIKKTGRKVSAERFTKVDTQYYGRMR